MGGVSSVAQGGKFGAGFLSGAVGGPSGSYGQGIGGVIAGTIVSAVTGGIVSVLGGGKFENGAVTASFAYLFNTASHRNPAVALRNEALKDGHLTLSEANAIFRANNDPNFSLTVDAKQLTVSQSEEFDVQGRAPGVITGIDYLVHGQVTLFRGADGVISILRGTYDFLPHSLANYSGAVGTSLGVARNIATYLGFYNATYAGSVEGTDYRIRYSGQPNVDR